MLEAPTSQLYKRQGHFDLFHFFEKPKLYPLRLIVTVTWKTLPSINHMLLCLLLLLLLLFIVMLYCYYYHHFYYGNHGPEYTISMNRQRKKNNNKTTLSYYDNDDRNNNSFQIANKNHRLLMRYCGLHVCCIGHQIYSNIVTFGQHS